MKNRRTGVGALRKGNGRASARVAMSRDRRDPLEVCAAPPPPQDYICDVFTRSMPPRRRPAAALRRLVSSRHSAAALCGPSTNVGYVVLQESKIFALLCLDVWLTREDPSIAPGSPPGRSKRFSSPNLSGPSTASAPTVDSPMLLISSVFQSEGSTCMALAGNGPQDPKVLHPPYSSPSDCASRRQLILRGAGHQLRAIHSCTFAFSVRGSICRSASPLFSGSLMDWKERI